MFKTMSWVWVVASVCHLEVYGGQRWDHLPNGQIMCAHALSGSVGFCSWWGSGQGAGKAGAATQLECVSAEELMEYLRVWSMQRLWDMCEATLFTCIYLFAGIKLHSASLYPRPPLLFLDSLQKYLKAFIVSSPLPRISLERCWPEPSCDFVFCFWSMLNRAAQHYVDAPSKL